MKYSRIFQILFFLLIVSKVESYAQGKGKVEFDNNTHNFGTVNEEDGKIDHDFIFKNTGSEPVTIKHVKASCGCTTPAWTKEPVMPGETGFIKAQYNPANRPGTFKKSLTVTTDGDPSSMVVYISGRVLSKNRTPKEEFPRVTGGIRYSNDKIDLGRVFSKDTVSRSFKLYNETDEPIKLSSKVSHPKHISVSADTNVIAPKSSANINLVYIAAQKKDFGAVDDMIEFKTDQEGEKKLGFLIKANIAEYFPPLNEEEKALAPVLALEKTEVDLGDVKAGSNTKTEVEIKNTGKQDLQIRKVKSNADNLNLKLDKDTVKEENSSRLKIQYKAPDKPGANNAVVHIYSNAPSSPVQTILIKANVVEK
ncbi:DUF1573 domain-containing protein [Cytophagaceae bacterium ABcell3]|nr:DUF1573 domain-containing protein [Cytophagaceae bacterium ABcell3]